MALIQRIGADPADGPDTRCHEGHRFRREDVEESVYIQIQEEVYFGNEEEFDYRPHIYSRTECPECGDCCTEEAGFFYPITADDIDEDEARWICLNCAKIYDDESEALDCCP